MHNNAKKYAKLLKIVEKFQRCTQSPFITPPLVCTQDQQFTYGVVSEGVVAETLQKFCGKFAEIAQDPAELYFQRIAKGAGGKGPLQKTSKIVKKFFDTFRHFSRRAKNVKNRQ